MKTTIRRLLAAALGVAALSVLAQESKSSRIVPVETIYTPSGWMGDGEAGTQYLTMKRAAGEIGGRQVVVTKFQYKPGPAGFGGIYWLCPDKNWGDKKGRDLKGARRIAFVARGETGNEIVSFKSGGIEGNGKPNHDSFTAALGAQALKKEWTRYTIDLSECDFSSVIGAFSLSVAASDVSDTATFYIAELQIEY